MVYHLASHFCWVNCTVIALRVPQSAGVEHFLFWAVTLITFDFVHMYPHPRHRKCALQTNHIRGWRAMATPESQARNADD